MVSMTREKRFKIFAAVSLVFIFITAIGYSAQEYINYKDNGSYVKVEKIKIVKPYDPDLREVIERGCTTSNSELINLTGLNMDVSKATANDRFVAFNKANKELSVEIDQFASLSKTPITYLCKNDNTTFNSPYIFHQFIVH